MTSTPIRLRFCSFNIRYAGADLSWNYPYERDWATRLPYVNSIIRFNLAGIIGLQEVLLEQLDDILTSFGEYQFLGSGRDDGQLKGEFSPILYRKDLYECKESFTLWLSESPTTPGSKSWGAYLPRVATWGRFSEITSEKEFWFINTHLDHLSSRAQAESAKLLLRHIKTVCGNLPVFLCGDLNADERSECYKILSQELKDTRLTTKDKYHEYEHTWVDFKPLNSGLNTIDHGFVRGFNVERHSIITVHPESLYNNDDDNNNPTKSTAVQASDHRPIFVDLTL